jgi:hypothetical protein
VSTFLTIGGGYTMRSEDELTKHAIHFTINGYKNKILSWLEFTVDFFEASGYPLKSVSYDINYHKIQRKSLKSFYKQLNEDSAYPIDRLYSFTVFSAVTQKYPGTWYYGCHYNEPGQELKIFFDTSFKEEDILSFFKNYLEVLLKDKTAWTGYLYDYRNNNLYACGNKFDTLNYYNPNFAIFSTRNQAKL